MIASGANFWKCEAYNFVRALKLIILLKLVCD